MTITCLSLGLMSHCQSGGLLKKTPEKIVLFNLLVFSTNCREKCDVFGLIYVVISQVGGVSAETLLWRTVRTGERKI